MHRFFVPLENISDQEMVLHGSDVAHIRTVLRLKSGDTIRALDGRGTQYVVRLTQVGPKKVRGCILSRESVQTESNLKIRMGQALIKGNKFDLVLRKAVELGVHHVVPLNTDRCVVKILKKEQPKKIDRWRRIAREAAKQCGRAVVPSVEGALLDVETFCRQSEGSGCRLMFWEGEEEKRLDEIKETGAPGSVACLVGPEGGFSPREVEAARRSGFQTVSLGPRILRAETAPVVVLSLLQYIWGDL